MNRSTAGASTVHTFSDDPEATSTSVPRLSKAMLRRAHAYGNEEVFGSGDPLFQRGRRGVDFYIVIEGRIEIYGEKRNGTAAIMLTLTDAQFTGELDLLSNRDVLLSCRAVQPSRVLRIPRGELQHMMRSEIDLAEVIMSAWIRRRAALVRDAQGGVILLCYAGTADSMRLQQFLSRNGYPFRLLDAAVLEDAEQLLKSQELKPSETPVVFLPDKRVLRNPSNALVADELGLSGGLDSEDCYDVAIVGAGPAGLAAAVYAASEDRVGSIICLQLSHNASRMTLHRLFGNVKFIADKLVRISSGDRSQYLKFTGRKSIVRKMLGNVGCNLSCDPPDSRVDRADGIHQFLPHHALKQILHGARLQGTRRPHVCQYVVNTMKRAFAWILRMVDITSIPLISGNCRSISVISGT